jgi:hypothetical protein
MVGRRSGGWLIEDLVDNWKKVVDGWKKIWRMDEKRSGGYL